MEEDDEEYKEAVNEDEACYWYCTLFMWILRKIWRAGLKTGRSVYRSTGSFIVNTPRTFRGGILRLQKTLQHYFCILLALKDADCKFVYKGVGINGIANDGKCIRGSFCDQKWASLKPGVCQPRTSLPDNHTTGNMLCFIMKSQCYSAKSCPRRVRSQISGVLMPCRYELSKTNLFVSSRAIKSV